MTNPRPTPPQRRLAIAVLTFERPGDLEAVLPLLVEQARSVADEAAARVLVVDNDPAGSAAAAVARHASAAAAAPGSIAIDYVVEARPGIAQARNRALGESLDDDFLVFIDDDERPSETWLRELLAMLLREGAAAVVGPVRSEYEIEPDPWIVAGEFFVRRRLPDGTRIDVAATNNLLLDLAFVREHGLSFDVSLGAFGGEDTLFTRQIVSNGGTMLWCAGAIVTDVVPVKRLTRRWVVQRAFSSGNGWSLTSLMLAGRGHRGAGTIGRARLRATLTAKGLVRIAGGLSRILRGLVGRSMAQRARGVRTVARGAGMVSGAWGYAYQEYRR